MARIKSPPLFWRHDDLPFVEGRQSCDSTACYRAHTHPTLSVGVIDRGEATMRLPGQRQRLYSGDVMVIGPGVVHSCNRVRDRRWSYRMFYFDPRWLRTVLRTDPSSTGLLEFTGVLRSPVATAILDRMTALVARVRPPVGCEEEMGLLLAKLQRLVTAASAAKKRPDPGRPDLAEVRTCLEERCHDKILLRELSALAGLSRYSLIRAFRREYGLTPHAYQLDQRIRQARELVRHGSPPTRVAYELGFADQSHFHRAFKARVAATPLEYQRPGRRSAGR